MANRFASGKQAIAECDRCGFRFKLKELRELVVKTKKTNVLVCRQCFDPDHPQLMLGSFPVEDPQALRNPRPDRSYVASGIGVDGNPSMGSRDTQWGWNPVGGGNAIVSGGAPNNLAATSYVGTVSIITS